MGVDRGEPWRAGKAALLVLVLDVLAVVDVLLAEAKIDQVDLAVVEPAEKDVLGLDVAVEDVLLVDHFQVAEHTHRDGNDRVHL